MPAGIDTAGDRHAGTKRTRSSNGRSVEAFGGQGKVLARFLKPDLLIIDDMGIKDSPDGREKRGDAGKTRFAVPHDFALTGNPCRQLFGKLVQLLLGQDHF
jgi:hypothetical protein